MKKTAVIYVRVSDPSQIDNFSLDTQEIACRKKATDLGCETIKLFREEGISAKSITDRPQLQEALLYCNNKKNAVGVFIVYSFSRLSRKTIDFLTIKAVLKKVGISLQSIVEPSGDDPENELISTIISSINQFDNEIKARIVKTNMRARFLQGYPLGRPKLGYTPGIVEGKPCPVPKDPEYSLVRSMWHKIRDEKLTLGEVQKVMSNLGFRKFSKQTLSGVFTSKFYMGIIQSGKYGEIKGKHQSMIDEDTYYKVRDILSKRKPDIQERHHLREDFPLRGVLMCEFCGLRLTGAWSSGRQQKYPYYCCGSRGIHRIISISASRSKDRFVELLHNLSANPKQMQLLSEVLLEQFEARVKLQQISATDYSKDLEQLKNLRKELAMKNLKGIYSDEDYLQLRNDLDDQIAQKYALAYQKQIVNMDFKKITEFSSYYFANLDQAWLKASLEGKVTISDSIFPKGVVCTKEGLRTPKVGHIYNLTKKYSEEIMFSTPSRIRTGDLHVENVSS